MIRNACFGEKHIWRTSDNSYNSLLCPQQTQILFDDDTEFWCDWTKNLTLNWIVSRMPAGSSTVDYV